MPFTFSADEYVDMLLVYGECRKNSRRAARLYQERFPHRPSVSHSVFPKLERKMRTGSFPNKKHLPHRNPIRSEENVVNVLAYVGVNPHTSIRKLSEEIGISKSTVQRILKQHKYHPFKIHLHQGLRPTDFERRLDFISLMDIMIHDNPMVLDQICWSDESRFHNNGVVNTHNAHYWSNENPHWLRQTRFQTVWGINVWCGLFNGRLIGPFFYEGTLTGERYLDFLVNTLPELMEDIPLEERNTMFWHQDGAPPHNARIIAEFLNQRFPNQWIGTYGPLTWPARSPDLNPLDFFLWGYLKELVYQTQPMDLEDLKERIREACRTITPDMIRATCTRALMRRFAACSESGGENFEHLLG